MTKIYKIKTIFMAIILFSFYGCSFFLKPLTPEQVKQKQKESLIKWKEEKIKILSKINLNDGIDEKEAQILATQYFLSFISGCGMPLRPLDKGHYWDIGLVVGYTATKLDKNLIIDKKTGKISLDLKGMPTLNNPIEELINNDSTAIIYAFAPDEWVDSSKK